MEVTPKKSKSKSKSKASEERVIEPYQNPTNLKRVKKAKNEVVVNEKLDDNEKQLFQRVWSEHDEIVVLEGLIEFRSKNGIDPTTNMSSFLEFVKDSLHFDASLTQLKDKVYKLKKKSMKHLSKGQRSLTTSHDQKVLHLAKRIWGGETEVKDDGVGSSLKSNENTKIAGSDKNRSVTDVDEPKTDMEKAVRLEDNMVKYAGKDVCGLDNVAAIGDIENYVLERGLDMVVDRATKRQMEEKWKKLQVAELELFVQKNELLMKQAKLMLKAYENED